MVKTISNKTFPTTHKMIIKKVKKAIPNFFPAS